MDAVPQMTDEEWRGTFDYFLRRAVFFGECSYSSCMGIDHETWIALQAVTSERTTESVIAARDAFERNISGVRALEDRAVRQAVRAGEVAATSFAVPADRYTFEMDVPDPDAATAWLAANRLNPGEIYRSMVLDRPESCL